MNTFFLTFFRPLKIFDNLKTTDKFSIMNITVLLLLIVINLILMVPVTEKIATITFSSMSLPAHQLKTMSLVVHKMRYLPLVSGIIRCFIMFFFYASLLYLFVLITKGKITYKNALQLIIYSYLIVAIGDLVNTALLYARGLDSFKNMYDTSLMGLNLLTSIGQVGATAYTFLSHITPFQLLFVVLLSFGLKIFTDIKQKKAIIISIVFWLIIILVPTLSVYFSQLAVAKLGIT